jgi:hypothetical protein
MYCGVRTAALRTDHTGSRPDPLDDPTASNGPVSAIRLVLLTSGPCSVPWIRAFHDRARMRPAHWCGAIAGLGLDMVDSGMGNRFKSLDLGLRMEAVVESMAVLDRCDLQSGWAAVRLPRFSFLDS